jgi:hypothetical protein
MNRLLDPNFDPLHELQLLENRFINLENNFNRLVAAHNSQSELISQIASQNNELLEQMASQDRLTRLLLEERNDG